jgi:hypothetical protein
MRKMKNAQEEAVPFNTDPAIPKRKEKSDTSFTL